MFSQPRPSVLTLLSISALFSCSDEKLCPPLLCVSYPSVDIDLVNDSGMPAPTRGQFRNSQAETYSFDCSSASNWSCSECPPFGPIASASCQDGRLSLKQTAYGVIVDHALLLELRFQARDGTMTTWQPLLFETRRLPTDDECCPTIGVSPDPASIVVPIEAQLNQ